jgi:Uma2 family endonuclease
VAQSVTIHLNVIKIIVQKPASLTINIRSQFFVIVTPSTLSLEEFLHQPETKPASEYIDGKIVIKPMPKRQHSLLQSEICMVINAVSKPQKLAYAFPELRCTFGGRSLVPDLAILRWEKIEFDEEGIPSDDVSVAPDWTIEILSPDQSSNRVIANILHCLKFGCQLGWLIDPKDRSILVFMPDRAPDLYQEEDTLPVLENINLNLTAIDIFRLLKLDSD